MHRWPSKTVYSALLRLPPFLLLANKQDANS